MLSTAQLEAMQAVLGESLEDVATRLQLSRVSDGQGGLTEAWTAADVWPCRLSPENEQGEAEPVRGAATRAVSGWTCTLPAFAQLDAGDRLQVLTADGSTGVFSVLEVRGPRSYELCVRVRLEQAT